MAAELQRYLAHHLDPVAGHPRRALSIVEIAPWLFDDGDEEFEAPETEREAAALLSEQDVRQAIEQLYQNDPELVPPWAALDEPKLLRHFWGIHCTRADPNDILRHGFTVGAPLEELTYTGSGKQHDGEGYNFAFDALHSLQRIIPEDKHSRPYGPGCILFHVTEALQVYHHGDGETQYVFWGPDVEIHERFWVEWDDYTESYTLDSWQDTIIEAEDEVTEPEDVLAAADEYMKSKS